MRRPKDKPTSILRTGDVKRDLSKEQLAAIGAAAMAYNVLEDQLDELLLAATHVPVWLFPEVGSRINGLEGKVEIIKTAIDEAKRIVEADLGPSHLGELKRAVEEFMWFKKTRDLIVHARLVNVAAAIAEGLKQRGKTAHEILLTKEALEAYYKHVCALERVYDAGHQMLGAAIAYSESTKVDPYRRQLTELLEMHSAQFQEHLRHRKSLAPLPKFPTEVEIQQAADRWHEALRAELMGWHQPLSIPHRRPNQNTAAFQQFSTNPEIFSPLAPSQAAPKLPEPTPRKARRSPQPKPKGS